MIARSIPPETAKIVSTDAPGLIDAYNRLRDSARQVATDLNIDNAEFDAELPSLPPFDGDHTLAPDWMMVTTARAKAAATALRSLTGHVEGLIEAVVLDQQITMEQVQAAREAARQPPGFH
jgi:hypothetical protein